ncbi:diphosphomevalonate decarboxylase [Plakobranchus ocellatus]|uniref:Diphosphomevalonate decarboxylase n=1 Tax=Plakobranchus ocellatus TaxID=259542 RepID=A0AAV4DNW7_9GAST|nr:diphosphomevalonate decarboxylase [Plakobranchus ocellatus]
MSQKTSSQIRCVTCTAPVNIAVIKYWGKTDEKRILPTNPSLSVTLGQDELRAKTSVAVSSRFTEDRMWLNGIEQSVNSPRVQNVLKEIRRRAHKRKSGENKDDLGLAHHVHIVSENNFPTAAGLASSAAGYACLVYALSKLFEVNGEISDIARQGSGSACRSLYGGYVLWKMASKDDGSDSHAVQVQPESHWPQMRALILVVSDQKKHVGSTEGMQTTVQTSELMETRFKLVERRTEDIIKAINDRDFPTFAKITMQESNQLHAVCLDTYPPIFYMTDTSRLIVRLVHAINDILGKVKVAYTFDAGPNACLYLLEEDVPRVLSLVRHFFPASKDAGNSSFVTGLKFDEIEPSTADTSQINLPISEGAVKYIIHTKVGPGPQVLKDPKESLFTPEGKPKL